MHVVLSSVVGVQDWAYWCLGLSFVALGASLTVWALFGDRPRGKLRCPRCWYDMTKSPGLRCSECGFTARRQRSLQRTHRRWGWATSGAIAMMVGWGLAATPRAQHSYYGWVGYVPTTVLVAGYPWLGTIDTDLTDELSYRVGQLWSWQRAWLMRRCCDQIGPGADLSRRLRTLEILALMGAASSDALPALLRAARDDDPDVREASAYAVGMIRCDAAASVSVLVELLRDADEDVRRQAAWALWKFGPDASEGAPALVNALEDESDQVRIESAAALCSLGGDPREALPILLEAMSSSAHPLRTRAILALGEIGPGYPEVVSGLSMGLEDPAPVLRVIAAQLLAKMGPDAAEAVPMLIKAVEEDESLVVRGWAARALGTIGQNASPAIPALERLAKHPDSVLSLTAVESLDAIQKSVDSD